MLHRLAQAAVVATLMVSFAAIGQDVKLNPDHPTVYVVKRGDTLWDISAAFLVEPWRWPEIWEVNPQVENPHLIYPGDELALFYRDGQPRIQLRRAGEAPGAAPEGVTPEGVTEIQTGPRDFKLTPKARVLTREDAIPTIPVDAIAQFLTQPLVLTEGEFEAAPYVVSVGSESLIGSAGRKVFVRGLSPEDGIRFGVYRRGNVYRSPADERQILGYEALQVADAVVDAGGDPSTVVLVTTTREVLAGDRLFPVREDQVVTSFHPRAPDLELNGQIISVVDGVTQIGENQIVVLDLGTYDGVQRGYVMAVYQRGETVRDNIGSRRELVKLPDRRAGTVLVFRPFERVSYALVMQASRAMHLFDVVKNP